MKTLKILWMLLYGFGYFSAGYNIYVLLWPLDHFYALMGGFCCVGLGVNLLLEDGKVLFEK